MRTLAVIVLLFLALLGTLFLLQQFLPGWYEVLLIPALFALVKLCDVAGLR